METSVDKPYSPACERNREPILAVLRGQFRDRRHVLEIGSGTGQHAVHFAAHLPWLTWQCSDRPEYLPGIRRWLAEAALRNTPPPLELDVARGPWPTVPVALPPGTEWGDEGAGHRAGGEGGMRRAANAAPTAMEPDTARFDAAFSANTLHIMGWPEVQAFFAGLGSVLTEDAILSIYGPFNIDGRFSSDSNAAFDASLKARDPRMGIRDLASVDALAEAIGLRRVADEAMPANNRLLTWRRVHS